MHLLMYVFFIININSLLISLSSYDDRPFPVHSIHTNTYKCIHSGTPYGMYELHVDVVK